MQPVPSVLPCPQVASFPRDHFWGKGIAPSQCFLFLWGSTQSTGNSFVIQRKKKKKKVSPMVKGSVTKNGGRAHTPWAMWVPGGSPYGLEGWLCYGAGGAVREGWALCLCQFIRFADGLSQDSRLPHLCLHLLGLLHPLLSASLQPVRQC